MEVYTDFRLERAQLELGDEPTRLVVPSKVAEIEHSALWAQRKNIPQMQPQF